MPVTRRDVLRNGVDEGQAPAQMPQLAHSSASTTAIAERACTGLVGAMLIAAYGQSATHRSHPLQFAASTCATGCAAERVHQGSVTSRMVSAPASHHNAAGEVQY